MDNTIIYILAIILLILIALNNITIITNFNSKPIINQANCSQTTFGCCPDGVNSKINFYGTNCPGYHPEPGYPEPVPGPGPQPPKPVGGCSGTRYGCCLDKITPKINEQGSNCLLH